MRTTIDIADDVLLSSKHIARRDKKTLGEVISELARRALQSSDVTAVRLPGGEALSDEAATRRLRAMGVVAFRHPQGKLVTNAMVDALREQEGI